MDETGMRSPHKGRDKTKPIMLGEYTYCDSCAEENMLPMQTGRRKVAYCIGCDKYCNCNVADDKQIQIHNSKLEKELERERMRR